MPDSKPAEGSMQGVLLAAGRGIRAYPSTRHIPKALLDIAGKTLIERNLEILIDQLNVDDVIIVVGHYGEQIRQYIGPVYHGAEISYVTQSEQKGIGDALLAIEPVVRSSHFFVMLADEFYIDANHRDFIALLEKNPTIDAAIMLRHEDRPNIISNNYGARVSQDRILSLTEKPRFPDNELMGLGSYLLTKKVFDYIRNTKPSALRNEVEITDVLSNMAQQEDVRFLMYSGQYLNVNTAEDRNQANYMIRDRSFDDCRISVVIPAYNEAESIAAVVKEFGKLKNVTEVLVIDNNSADATARQALGAGAKVISELSQGYGCALKRGLDEALGDIVILTEADSSFSPTDAPKLLEYLKDCDMVIGTRTTRQMIEQGANMGFLARLVNVIFGKLIEVLWWGQEPRFTDVGCTYRAIWKTSYEKARPYIDSTGPAFAPDMMIALLICKLRIIEIPVTYRKRFGGDSKHSGNFYHLSRTALQMLKLIVKRRLYYSSLNRGINDPHERSQKDFLALRKMQR
jgi:dTDP-glucose pyrophosphorylase